MTVEFKSEKHTIMEIQMRMSVNKAAEQGYDIPSFIEAFQEDLKTNKRLNHVVPAGAYRCFPSEDNTRCEVWSLTIANEKSKLKAIIIDDELLKYL